MKRGNHLPRPVAEVLQQILDTQSVLHSAGTMSNEALSALAAYASGRAIRRSAETGCGASTLLLSHLSESHTVFALDVGNSVSNVRQSALLRSETVHFVEGPSQCTLPKHRFSGPLQLALIDGPHAYPFPDLEYYYLYPHLETGALLVLDDIQIRSIRNLFEFLRCDPMFRLEEVVRSTAFFVRTDAPVFDPMGDGWQEQPYNQRTLLRYNWRARLKRTFSGPTAMRLEHLRKRVARADAGCRVKIQSPHPGEGITEAGMVSGTAQIGGDAHLWVLVHRADVNGWWPQGGRDVPLDGGQWAVRVKYGEPRDVGFPFEVAAVVVNRAVHEQWLAWLRSVQAMGTDPPTQMPNPRSVLAADYVTVRRVESLS